MNQTSASSYLLYGASGSHKTTNMLSAAEYIYEETGRPVRLVNAETAGADLYAPYIEAGIVEPIWMSHKIPPRSALKKITRGAWMFPTHKVTGQAVTMDKITPENMKDYVVKWVEPEKQPQDMVWPGGYIVEGLTSIAELILQYLTATGRKINEDVVGLYNEEGENLGAPGRSHYGAVHSDIMYLLDELPKQIHEVSKGQVRHVFFTGHEAKGEDEETRQPIYGPATVGKAITNKIQKKVGTLLHAQEVVADPKTGKREVRIYWDNHPDPDNSSIKWMCKPRIPPIQSAVDQMGKKFPGGYFVHTLEPPMGLKEYLKFQDSLKGLAAGRLASLAAALKAKTGANSQ